MLSNSLSEQDGSRRRLRAMRVAAAVALAVVLCLMVLGRHLERFHPGWGYLRAFGEAATVGALADWFAVVALFRHPLGIPIPHTAILPGNKERVAQSVADFVQANFLTEEALAPRLLRVDYVGAATRWLQDHSGALVGRIVEHAPRVIDGLSDSAMSDLLASRARSLILAREAAPLAAEALRAITDHARDREIFCSLLGSAEDLIAGNRELIQRKIRDEIPLPVHLLREIPGLKLVEATLSQIRDFLAAAVAQKTIEKIQGVLEEAKTEPDHELWHVFHQRLGRFISDLEASPEMAERMRRMQNALAESAAVDEFSIHAWREAKAFLLRDCASETSLVRARICEAFESLSAQIARSDESRREINRLVAGHVLANLLLLRKSAHEMVRGIIEKWDAAEMASKLENAVGPDLQFIRLNGTLIGGAIGIILHFLLGAVFPNAQ